MDKTELFKKLLSWPFPWIGHFSKFVPYIFPRPTLPLFVRLIYMCHRPSQKRTAKKPSSFLPVLPDCVVAFQMFAVSSSPHFHLWQHFVFFHFSKMPSTFALSPLNWNRKASIELSIVLHYFFCFSEKIAPFQAEIQQSCVLQKPEFHAHATVGRS